MGILETLLAFVLAAGLLTVTPGLDTALVLRTNVASGPRQAALAGVGIVLGCLAWGLVVALGLGMLLTASDLAFNVLKWIGAAYLVWLGIGLLRRPRTGLALDEAEDEAINSARAWFVRGFLTNLLNPKIGVFYVSFLPQFLPHGVDAAPWTMLLAGVHGVLGLLWFAALILASRLLTTALRSPRVIASLDRTTGIVFVSFGLKLAASSR
jgi:threonine/homoserine/homoserine lactone efflux protein